MYQFKNFKVYIQNINGSMNVSPYSLLLAKNIPKLKNSDIVFDLACGSGILGIIAYLQGSDNVICSDITDESILDTIHNCKLNKIYNIKVIKSDMFKDLLPIFGVDLILCNPPSLPSSHINKPEYWSGFDGRDFINKLLLNAPLVLKNGGKILMTHTSLCDINKTYSLINGLKNVHKITYTCKIIDKISLKFRNFYDVKHIMSLKGEKNNDNLYIKKEDGLYEVIYVLELTCYKNISKL